MVVSPGFRRIPSTREEMLLCSLQEPDSGVHVQQLICELHEELNQNAFQKAWQTVAERHPSLRSRFHRNSSEELQQAIYPTVELPWDIQDWESANVSERESKLARLLQLDRQQGFDMEHAPLLRLTLIRFDSASYHFIWSYHKTLPENESPISILREVFAHYDSYARGEAPTLPEPRVDKSDFDETEVRARSEAEDFWRTNLSGFSTPTSAPAEPIAILAAASRFERGAQDTQLGKSISEALRSFAQAHGITLHTIILGAWALLLSRYNGTEDVLFGTICTCRNCGIDGTAALLGLLINTVPLRVRASRDTALVPWLQELGAQWTTIGEHAHIPPNIVQSWSEVPKEAPLFESVVNLSDTELDTVARQPGAYRPWRRLRIVDHPTYPLNLTVCEREEVAVKITFDRCRFSDSTVGRILGHLKTVLVAFVAHPEQHLRDVSVLTPDERHQLVVEWNSTSAVQPRNKRIHQLIEEQAEKAPERKAVIFEEQALTYRELDERSNQLAHLLRRRGVKQNVMVAIYLERSLDIVAGLIGILKAGGAYVPLDPSYPKERIAFILEDTHAPILLTTTELHKQIPPCDSDVVYIDTDHRISATPIPPPILNEVSKEDLAYVIYTSGSTGRPKGVLVTHANLAHSTHARLKFYKNPPERLLLVGSFAFDSSVAGLFWTLCTGGTLVLPAEGEECDPVALARLIKREEITHALCMPSLYALLLRTGERLSTLRAVIVGGESCPPALPGEHARQQPGTELVNEFGPTEGTVWCTACRLSADSSTTSIGRPIGQTRVYLLDEHRELVPIGVAGELYIGGDGVARGYLNRPELTAEKFVPDPFSAEPGARLYRTGDLCRYRPDGSLEFLGRIDHQVKIRGFRIELGEIESMLALLPSVSQGVVVAREDQPGDRRLVAYLVPAQNGSAPDVSTLREALRQKLPEYMVPSAFVFLEALPLTPNGKIDRRALPAPDLSALQSSHGFVAPASPLEEVLAGIWARVLGVERVGTHDNFFELGGHSLLAAQVVARIRQALGTEVPIRLLFECPTIVSLARRLPALQGQSLPAVPPLVAVPRTSSTLPLSFAQQRLWLEDRIDGSSTEYHLAEALRLQGTLDCHALQLALNAIVTRHESLRTRFVELEGEPVQLIEPALSLELPLEDLSSLKEAAAREQALVAALQREQQSAFDLSRGPLVRLRLFRLAENVHVLSLVFHHIVYDGWSMGVFHRELAALYESFCRGEAQSPLPPPALQYPDYALWQRQWLQGPELERLLSYWTAKLSGAPPLLALPTDHPRSASRSPRAQSCAMALPPELTRALEGLCRQEGVTFFMALLAAFKVLLARYSGQEDIVVGTPIAGRTREALEELIGFFIGTLALRTDLSGNPGFRELLGRVRSTALEAYAHQDLPFEKLIEKLQPERNLSYSPVFQVFFNMLNFREAELAFEGLQVEQLPLPDPGAIFDLVLYASEVEDSIHLRAIYNAELFEAATIERMLARFQTLLQSAIADPSQPIHSLPVLTPGERHQLLVEWNSTDAEYPRSKCIHELFAEQAQKTPDAVALAFEDRQLSYRELDSRANQLAHHLRSLGVGPEVLVAICVERSPEMVIGLLGILKAGGAYVPLDPAYPKERLAFIVEDADAKVLITQERLRPLLPACQAELLSLDAGLPGSSESTTSTAPASGVRPENLAYIIYTSGSTGRPKGVAIEHRNAAVLIGWAHQTFSPEELSGVLASTSICFDLSVFELFVPLSCGGKVILAENILQLPSIPAAAEVTLVNTVPSGIAELVRSGVIPASVTTVCLAGEPLKCPLVRQIYQQRTVRRVYDLYGPSEDTTYSTFALRQPEGPETIGRPLSNKQLYLLDEHRELVPVGVAGELYIGGDGVARGYLNRPELTAEKFVPDPFSSGPEARLYRTGDLCRYRPDGCIEFLGRIDHQVKIRGFRIELGEIESVLTQHPAIAQCIAVAREDQPGDKRLVAYLVPEQKDCAPEPASLREALRSKLPEYMVPSAFVFLQALPLTPNGKIDRRALPAPDLSDLQSTQAYVAPSTPLEEVLAGIWAKVLGVERVGTRDNFFELGGHSLLAAQVVARIRQALETEVPIRTLFECPTIAALALRIPSFQGEDRPAIPSLVPVPRTGSTGGLPLSFGQQRLWLEDRIEGSSTKYHMSEVLRLQGALNRQALERAINAIVARHESLRTRFVELEGEPVQLIEPRLSVALPLEDLSTLEEAAREQALAEALGRELEAPFDLSRVPLLRLRLFRLAEDEHVLSLIIHHIVYDGWSIGIFHRELSALYQAFCRGEEQSPLAPLPLQYPDYALWQRQWLQGSELDRLLSYWTEKLAGAPPLLTIPTDHPRTASRSRRAESCEITLPADVTRALERLCRQEGVTFFMALLAAFKVLLARYSGQEDIVVGTPIAGRTREALEELIGFFIGTLALRTDLSANPGFRELLGRVRSTALEAYAHQDLPFEKLIEKLQPERNLSYSPVFQVFFNMLNFQETELPLEGLRVEHLPLHGSGTIFDLMLYASEAADSIQLRAVYNAELFEAATIERMLARFQILLQSAVADPTQPIHSLPILTAEERHQLLVEWNSTAAEYPRDKCIHELFEEQVRKTPEAVALIFGTQQLSYRELDRRADRLAQHLRSRGVGPEVLVAICVERSLEMVVGLLGILKAGGAYVPLDPAYPKERLAFIVEDADAKVLITQERLRSLLPTSRAEVVTLDSELPPSESTAPLSGVRPQNLAYIIYTSGSTGRPKGVAIEHRNAAVLIGWAHQTFTAEELSAVLASTSICFDLSVFELFVPLSCGGKVILAENILHLPSLPAAQEVILVNTVPSGIAELVRSGGIPASVTTVNLAGEPLKCPLVGQIYQQQSIRRVYDLYGPSEDTTYSTFALREAEGPETIGRPLSNKQLYILDEHRELVPVGVAGELYIGGDGLARGYLNRPELTAEKFIPNPFSQEPGARLYRTGDLCRYRPDGCIEFLGRIDHQVKIRGFRIELGEIESVLAQLPSISQCIAVAREDQPGDRRLVAYLVAAQHDCPPELASLREALRSKLPEYMVPSAFVFLQALPLTPNGKIDRRALPAPDLSDLQSTQAYVAPSTPLEEVLAGIWAKVLGVERVGTRDNFFELGGHSLLAAQVVARIRQALETEVPIRLLFECPTIAALALRIPSFQGEDRPAIPSLVPVPRTGSTGGLPLSFGQQRLWLEDRIEGSSTKYHMSEVLRLQGALNRQALERAINAIVARHESLRTRFVELEGEPVQLIEPRLSVALPLEDLSTLEEAAREQALAEALGRELEAPFDLSRVPLLRLRLFRLAEDEHVLSLIIHHIVYDGWSIGIFHRELSALYQAFCRGEEQSPLAPLPLQYPDYALWQRQWLQGSELDRLLSYWTEKLAGAPPLLTIPTDHPRTASRNRRAESCEITLPADVSRALERLCRQEGVTFFMALLAAFKVLLARYSGQEDIVVGTPIAGRTREALEELIGFFIGTLALRTDLSANPGFRELLGRVRSTALEAYAHQDLPFEKLIEKLQPERNLSYSPVFQVFFNMLNFQETELPLEGLRVEHLPLHGSGTIFDLMLYASEAADSIQLRAVYNAELFEAATIERMLARFQILLEAAVTDPARPIHSLPILTAEDLRHYSVADDCVGPGNPFVPFATEQIEQSIPERFQHIVRLHGERMAVRTRHEKWTYAELNHRSNVVAQTLLHRCGHGTGTVALLCAHGAPMIAAILAVLKAGKTYVPLDPAHPKERLACIIKDGRAEVILTDAENRELAGELSSDGTSGVIALEQCDYQAPCDNIDLSIAPDTIAYLLYTSGSTGMPKGVTQIHRNVLQHIRNYTNSLHICAEDRMLLVASYGFDAAVMDIFGALMNGAALYPYDVNREGLSNLAGWMAEQKITIYHSTPTLYRHLLATLAENQILPVVRLIVMGGEPVVPQDIALFRKHSSEGCLFVNGYGPTESTVTLQYFMDTRTAFTGYSVPAGYPVDGTEVLLLSASGEPGQIYGEIAIRSRSIAIGYWQRPELTAAFFSQDPHVPEIRTYRTGDLGRLTTSGMIELAGRIDHQVKIRGFRIELGEIESVLTQHPAIAQCVAVAREDQPGDRRLVAYLVPEQKDCAPEPASLREALRSKLPEYMVPSAFVFLQALPLTPNGKIDRRALPAPDLSDLQSTQAYVAPATPLEEVLAGIWAKVLGLERVGTHDNFFELGGHSLLALKMLYDVEALCGKRVPLVTLFTHQTIRELARTISREGAPETPHVLALQTEGSRPPLFFFYGEVLPGLDFCTELARRLGPDQPFYVVPLLESVERQMINLSMEEIVRDLIQTLRSVSPEGPYILGGFCNGALLAYAVARQLEEEEEPVELLLLIDVFDPKSDFLAYSRKVIETAGTRVGMTRLGQFRIFILLWNFLLRFRGWQRLRRSKESTRFFYRVARWLSDLPRHTGLSGRPLELSSVANDSQSIRDMLLAFAWMRARYYIRPYSGRAALFLSDDAPVRRNNPSCGWAEVTSQLEIHHVAGSHRNCVTDHRDLLCEKIKGCIEDVLSLAPEQPSRSARRAETRTDAKPVAASFE